MVTVLLAIALAQTPVDLKLLKGAPPSSSNPMPVSGVITSGTVTANQGTPGATPWIFQISDGARVVVVTAANALKVDGSAVTQPISAVGLPLPTGAATEAGNLATIAAKDFATQATLALIKAKTDNLDVLLSTRTKPADTQPVSLATAPTTTVAGLDFAGNQRPLATNPSGVIYVVPLPAQPINPLLQRCNAVRRTFCQP